ncbi:MAG: DUF4175 family protein, partial [Pseudomonadota bacterium]
MAIFGGGGLRGSDMRRVQRQLRLTRWAMTAEAVAQAFWPTFVVVCLAGAMGLLGGFAALGPMGHRIMMAVALGAFAAAAFWGFYTYRKPRPQAVVDRLDGADPKRPLAALRDDLAVGKGSRETETVWRAFRDRARDAAVALRARAPDLRLASVDRWALRLLAPVLLIGGVIATGGAWPERIAAMTDPAPIKGPAATVADRAPMAEAWAVPPAYTGLQTVYLERPAAGTEPLQLPQGSEITVRVTDFADLPVLEVDDALGMQAFSSLGGGLSEAAGVLSGSGTLTVKAGEEVLASWPIGMIPDQVPEIELDAPPT